MLTVEQILALPELHGAQLIAGAAGAHHPVHWVHVTGVPDAPDWLNGGELVLTTAINMPTTDDGQRAYLLGMVQAGVAALVIAVGRYIDRLPDAWRAIADQHALPLVEIPYQARFVDIARAVNQRLIDENAATTARSLHIHRVLTQLVLDGGDLKDLARTMADLIGQSISIENEKFEALASHNIADVDEARRYTLVQGRTNPHLIAALEAGRYLQQIRASLRPVQLPRIPEVGLEMERILAPIVVHGDIYGYVWIIADDRPLSELDRLAIESGATIAALMLFYQETVISTEASLKGGLIAQLIELAGDAHVNGRDAVLTDQAMRYGVNLNAPFSALLVEMPSNDAAGRPSMNGQSDRLSSRALHTYRKVDHAIRAGEWRAVVGQFAGQILALAQHDDVTIPAIAAAMLDAFALEERAPGRIALSAQARGASGVAAAYHQCRDALNIAARLGDSRRIVPFETLGYLHTLYTSGIDGVRANPYVARLRPLIDETQADLFHTLDVYLDSGANGVGTAEQLHIHRSTLNYRLQQIEKICAVDLSDAILRTNLQVALKLIRLFG